MKKYRIICLLTLTTFLVTSCEGWLDVKPKTQIESSELFVDESGYKDALWGIYALMSEQKMYGLHMTASIDAMAQMYSSPGASSIESKLAAFNYTDLKTSQTLIDTVWSRSYYVLANVNNLLHNIESADAGMFKQDNYKVIHGEALGLRAFLHFDLLRLFAPSYAAEKDAPAIPYVFTFENSITKQSTVTEVIDNLITDLTDAADLLRVSDPVVTEREIGTKDDDGYLLNRSKRFNYYAAIATLARVYLWKGDKVNALKCAQEVINSGKYKWTSVDNMAVVEAQRNRTFTPEQIFALDVENLATYIEKLFTTDVRYSTGTALLVSSYVRDKIYPYTTDWRGNNTLYLWSETTGSSSYGYRVSTKFYQYDDMPTAYKHLMPLIRLPEMHLIVAECDATKAPATINTIRDNRGIAERFSLSATQAEIDAEIMNEYRREFNCEGVIWYYWKRLNPATIPYFANYNATPSSQTMTKARWVWPMPAQEVEFGKRK